MAAGVLGDDGADQLHLRFAEQPSAVAQRLRRHVRDHPGGRAAGQQARLAAVPGQEPLVVLRHPTAGACTGAQILGQPGTRVDLPPFQRMEQAEQRRAQLSAPPRPRAVVVLAPHHRAAQRALGLVVVHRQVGVLHEPRQPLPVVAQALQHLRARRRQLRLLHQFAFPPLLHRTHAPPSAPRRPRRTAWARRAPQAARRSGDTASRSPPATARPTLLIVPFVGYRNEVASDVHPEVLRATYLGICCGQEYVAERSDHPATHENPSIPPQHNWLTLIRLPWSRLRAGGDMIMFEDLFIDRGTIASYRAWPLLDERLSYLRHCAEAGSRPSTLRKIAVHQASLVHFLDLHEGDRVTVPKWRLWSVNGRFPGPSVQATRAAAGVSEILGPRGTLAAFRGHAERTRRAETRPRWRGRGLRGMDARRARVCGATIRIRSRRQSG